MHLIHYACKNFFIISILGSNREPTVYSFYYSYSTFISTHDSTRESTTKTRFIVSSTLSFQLTVPQGSRQSAGFLFYTPLLYFNSRLRKGADTMSLFSETVELIFQLTAPQGSRRLRTLTVRLHWMISTHGSAREPTQWHFLTLIQLRHFNSRLRKGADAFAARVLSCWYNFNSRLRKGADTGRDGFTFHLSISTHGSAREPTFPALSHLTRYIFQLTAPQGSRRFSHFLRIHH